MNRRAGSLMIRCTAPLVLLGCLWLLAPRGAIAAVCVPPGVSGASQYVETVPGSSCNRTPSGPRGNGGPGGALPRQAAGRLAEQGPVGLSVARLVGSTGTAPRQAGGGSRSSRNQSGGGLAAGGHGWLWGLVHPVLSGSSSGGLGGILPLILLLVLVVMLARWSARRLRPRSRHR
jgi:hypothetical protein